MDQLRVAVIGCGGHAQRHFDMIAREPRLRLAAIAELDTGRRERATAQHRPERSFGDYRQMLESCDLDVVYVITMPLPIMQIVLECLEGGLHVSVEKPPGMTSRETETMAEAARKSKGKVIVSFDRRYIPEVLAVRRKVQERRGAVHCAATFNYAITGLDIPHIVELTPDPVIGAAIHHVDLLRWLAGRSEGEAAIPTEVYSEVQDGDRLRAHRQNAVVRFDTGAIGAFMSHLGVGGAIQRAEVHAEDLSVYLDLTGEPRYELYEVLPGETGAKKGTLAEEPLDLEAIGGKGFNETRHFVDCILEDRTPWSNLDDAVLTMRLCEAIRRGHKGRV